MRCYPLQMTVDMVYRRQKEIDPQPQYQRAPVWKLRKKQLLIDSILRGFDMPKFYLRRVDSGSPFEWEVVDGQQRFRTIWEFIDGDFELSEESADLPGFGDLSGQSYVGLSHEAKDKLHGYPLSVVEIQDATEPEIRDLFLRLQEGVPLNPAERRHAMVGGLRDFIADLAGEGETIHPVLPLLRTNNDRYQWEDWLAHVIRLELAGGPGDVKAADLKKMYEAETGFDPDGKVARKTKRILKYMARILRSEPPEMDIKWGFVDLYLVLSQLDEDYDLAGRHEDFLNFYVSFEADRREVDDAAELIESGGDEWDRDLYHYIEDFTSNGAKRASIERRNEVYSRRVLRDIPDLVPKDPKRAFSADQRIVIYRRDNQICRKCGDEMKFKEMHADHITPHARGGKTTVENGQALCSECNLSKGGSTPISN